eukprot:488464_1
MASFWKWCILLFPIVLTSLFTAIVHFGVRKFLLFNPIPDVIKQQISELQFDSKLPALTPEDITQYHDKGYVIVKNAIDTKTIEAMRSVTHHIMSNPSGMLKRANKSKFCGFSLHNHLLIPEWRNITYNLPISQYAAELMNTDVILYSQDIIHSTTSHCFEQSNKTHIAASRAHSDQNQSPYSIEKKLNVFGDNMIVMWIALDNLDHITMEMFDKTHKLFTNNNNKWNPYKYCDLWRDIEHDMDSTNTTPTKLFGIEKEIINLNVGDVALFQGLTFHRVIKTNKCKLDTCRRVTIRYVDGQVTKWRDDVPKSKWPFIQQMSRPGQLVVNDLPRVYDKRKNGSVDWGICGNGKPLIPPLKYWMQFIWHILKNGFNPGSIIFQCHNQKSYA